MGWYRLVSPSFSQASTNPPSPFEEFPSFEQVVCERVCVSLSLCARKKPKHRVNLAPDFFCPRLAILQLKWARQHGNVLSDFDKAFLAWYVLYSAGFGVAFWRAGVYLPLVPLWAAPAATVVAMV